MRTKKSKETITLKLSKEEIAALALVIRMGGYHRRKEYPEHLRETDSTIVRVMSRLLKKLEKSLKN